MPLHATDIIASTAIGVDYCHACVQGVLRAGLNIPHSPAGLPQMAFDLNVYFQGRVHRDQLCFVCQRVFFDLVDAGDPGQSFKVALSTASWERFAKRRTPSGAEPWRDLETHPGVSTGWREMQISHQPWGVGLMWPRTRPDGPRDLFPLATADSLGIWRAETHFAAVNRRWLEKCGELVIGDRTSSFFPQR